MPEHLKPAVVSLVMFLSFAGCAAPAVSTRGVPAAQPRPAEIAPADVRVMSVNARVAIFIDGLNHWSFRKALLVDTIRSFDPDLIGTQECLAEQADYLRERLSDYEFVGVGRSDGDRRGEMCGVLFRRARYERLDAGHFWLSETPQRPGSRSWRSSVPRMATWVKLRDRSTGAAICFFNTHLDHLSGRAREESAKLLRERMASIAGGAAAILCGDFNAGEGSAPYRTLVMGDDGRSLTDTYRAANAPPDRGGEGTRHDFWGGRGGARIDWILSSPHWRTVAAGIDRTSRGGRFPSDHFPVTAVLRPVEATAARAPAAQRAGG